MEWIKCRLELPEDLDDVLVLYHIDDLQRIIAQGWRCSLDTNHFELTETQLIVIPTHWAKIDKLPNIERKRHLGYL